MLNMMITIHNPEQIMQNIGLLGMLNMMITIHIILFLNLESVC